MRLTAKGYIIGSFIVLGFYLILTFGFSKLATDIADRNQKHYNAIDKILESK